MKHEMTIDFRTMYNIVCAAAVYYEKYQQEIPEIFDDQDAYELKMAIKIRHFLLETNAEEFKIEDK